MNETNLSLCLNIYMYNILVSGVKIHFRFMSTSDFFINTRVTYVLSKSWKKIYFYFKSFYRYYRGTDILKKKWPFFFIKSYSYYSIIQHFFKILHYRILQKYMKNGFIYLI